MTSAASYSSPNIMVLSESSHNLDYSFEILEFLFGSIDYQPALRLLTDAYRPCPPMRFVTRPYYSAIVNIPHWLRTNRYIQRLWVPRTSIPVLFLPTSAAEEYHRNVSLQRYPTGHKERFPDFVFVVSPML